MILNNKLFSILVMMAFFLIGLEPLYAEDKKKTEEFKLYDVNLEKAPEQREEMSPYINRIDFIESDDSLALFLEGWVPYDCYDQREVEISGDVNLVKVTPRFMRNNYKKECHEVPVKFAQKIYEFPKADALPEKVAVLGFQGWHYRDLPEVKKVLDLPAIYPEENPHPEEENEKPASSNGEKN